MIRRIRVRAKHAGGRYIVVCVPVLPDDFTIRCHFPDFGAGALVNKRIAVRQAMCSRYKEREKSLGRFRIIQPDFVSWAIRFVLIENIGAVGIHGWRDLNHS